MQTFNEWMSVRQMNEPLTAPGTFQFSGTYDLEAMPSLIENSKKISVEEARKLVPAQYENQFSGMQELKAGTAVGEENKELLWICNESGLVYIFEKSA